MILIRNALLISALMLITVQCQLIPATFQVPIVNQQVQQLPPTNVGGNVQIGGGNRVWQSAPQSIQSRAVMLESFRRISEGAQKFSFEMLTTFSDAIAQAAHQTNRDRDFMISPFAIWSLLMLLVEGANGKSLSELRNTMHIDQDQLALRNAFRVVQNFLTLNTSTVEVASLQALFTDSNQPLDREYENIIERDYNSRLFPVDFHDPYKTYEIINEEVRKATRGLIKYAINPSDINNINLFMLSSLYFKGQWKNPFNKSFTRTEPFYDEEGDRIGDVEMMFQEASLNFTNMQELEGHVLELPYGNENRLSMLIILPRKGVTLNKVFRNLEKVGLAPIFAKLAADSLGFEDETIEVYMPKFSTGSDFTLNSVLEQLGIRDIFSATNANLSKMSPNVYVSSIIHSTKIIVDEEGTVAGAYTGAVLANKSTPPKFYLNRPFIYLIIEKTTNLLLFAGQLTNPNNVQTYQ